jgi:DNA polymerase-1
VSGRRRLIPPDASEWNRFTALVNTPVQGGCADGLKRAMVRLHHELPREARLISTVHDELIVEAPGQIALEVCEQVRTVMCEAMAGLFPQVPIEVEAHVCSSWAEK